MPKLAWEFVCVVAFERSRSISARYPFLHLVHITRMKTHHLRYARDMIYYVDGTMLTQNWHNEGDIWYFTSISKKPLSLFHGFRANPAHSTCVLCPLYSIPKG